MASAEDVTGVRFDPVIDNITQLLVRAILIFYFSLPHALSLSLSLSYSLYLYISHFSYPFSKLRLFIFDTKPFHQSKQFLTKAGNQIHSSYHGLYRCPFKWRIHSISWESFPLFWVFVPTRPRYGIDPCVVCFQSTLFLQAVIPLGDEGRTEEGILLKYDTHFITRQVIDNEKRYRLVDDSRVDV